MTSKPNYKSYARQYQVPDPNPGYNPQRQQPYRQQQQYSSGSPHMKHWKSYLAPQLNNQEYDQGYDEQEQDQTESYYSGRGLGREKIEGVRSYGYLDNPSKLDRSGRSGGGDRREKDDQYSRRKDEILNRIKALQDKTSNRERGKRETENSEKSRRAGKLEYDDDVEGRLAALEERVDNMESEFEQRIERVVKDLQSRFGFR